MTTMRSAMAAAAFGLLALSGPVRADEPLVLRFALPGETETTATYTGIWQPWIARVEADSDGTLKLQPYFTIANFGNVYDRLVGGAADIATALQGVIGGKFPGTSVIELPSDIGGRDGAGALWKLYQDGLIAAEYGEVRPLALYAYPQSVLSAQRPVKTLADIKGLRIATLSRGAGDIAERLGAAPISTSPPDLYEILQHHTADSAIIGWLGVTQYKVAELTTYHLAVGLNSAGGFLMMNKDSYAKLPPKPRAAIDKNSGAAASEAIGAGFDKIYAKSEDAVRHMAGHTVVSLAAADKTSYARDIAGPVTDAWVKRTPNGAAILADYRNEAARIRAAK